MVTPCCPVLPSPAPEWLYLDGDGQPSALVLVYIDGLSPYPQVVGMQGRLHAERELAHDASGGLKQEPEPPKASRLLMGRRT